MRDKLTQFISNLNGQWVEVSDRSNVAQCMDLVYNWVFALGFPKSTIQHLYAYEAYTLASDFTRQYFDVIPNLTETIPQEGDIVVWNKTSGNVAGHIAIVIEATQTKMKVFEQNSPVGSNSHIGDKSYTNCLGFLRPKVSFEGGIPQYLKTLAQEVGIDINNEGQVRAFWEKGRKYDEELKTLREQVISKSEALSSCNTEVATVTANFEGLESKLDETTEILNKVRSERDKATWEATQLNLQVEAKVEEITKLTKRISDLEDTKKYQVILTWKDYQLIKKV